MESSRILWGCHRHDFDLARHEFQRQLFGFDADRFAVGVRGQNAFQRGDDDAARLREFDRRIACLRPLQELDEERENVRAT